MARPKLEQQERKDYLISVRLTAAEKESLQRLVEYTGSSVADVIRDLVRKDRVLKARVSRLDQKTYLDVIGK